MQTQDLPFPILQKAMHNAGCDIPEVDETDMQLVLAPFADQISFGAFPYMLDDHPFAQSIDAAAGIGAPIARRSRAESLNRRRDTFGRRADVLTGLIGQDRISRNVRMLRHSKPGYGNRIACERLTHHQLAATCRQARANLHISPKDKTMSMKRILGTMLASRMASRGGARGALGTVGALGMLGSLGRRKGGGMGSKMGLAALGYMAYQAYQGRQSNQTRQPSGQDATGQDAAGGIMNKVRDLANDLLGDGDQNANDQQLQEGEAAAERFSEDEALLMIRAMITAAYADGALSQDERARILQAIDASETTPAERQFMEREIANPKSLDALLTEVNDAETAQEFYLASRAALDGDTDADRRYLSALRETLGLSVEEAAEADAIAS